MSETWENVFLHKSYKKRIYNTYFVDRLGGIKLMENKACKYGIKKINLTKVFKFPNLYCTRRNRNHVRAHIL